MPIAELWNHQKKASLALMTIAMEMTQHALEGQVPLLVDANTIRRCTPMPLLIAALRRAFATGAVSPPRHSYELPGKATLLLMPAWQSGGHSGVKVVTVQPAARPAIQATYLLMDGITGKLKAVMDGTMLTPRRTAAASALACDYLARKDASTLLMIGTGALAPHLVEAHRAVRPIHRVMIWGRDPMKSQMLVDQLRSDDLKVSVASDLETAILQADVISAATLSDRAIIHGASLRPGVHIDLVGAFRPDMAEADPATFARSRVFIDTYEGVFEEAGDLLQAITTGQFERKRIKGDLTALCAGRVEGRISNTDITLFKSVGASMEDLVAAELVFQACATC